MITFQQIIEYLLEHLSDPVPKYIFIREILKKDRLSHEFISAYNNVKQTEWYHELSSEQWEDGSWGRFHSEDTKAKKQRFFHTEGALRRAREMSLPKEDPMIFRCIKIMELYIQDEKLCPDRVSAHKHKNKEVFWWFPFMVAAQLNLIDPGNPIIKPFRDAVVETTRASLFSNGVYDESVVEQADKEKRVPNVLAPGNAYNIYMLKNVGCMEDSLQIRFLDYVWNDNPNTVYLPWYSSDNKKVLEEKSFIQWLTFYEALSDYSMFTDFAKDKIRPHLFNEAERLIKSDVELFKSPSGHTYPCAHVVNGRYANNWRDINKRKADMLLRLARLLIKCKV